MRDLDPSATDVENGAQSMLRKGCRSADAPSAPTLDKGARALVLLFLGALVVGAIVVAVHPGYRAAFRSMLPGGGGNETSPIWKSNARYYDNTAPTDGKSWYNPATPTR